MKKSFTILEILLVVIVISILSTIFIYTTNKPYSKIDLAADQILMHMKYVRHLAMVDNRFNPTEPMWFRSRWRIKFLRCRNNSGIYYTIFSDKNYKGSPNKDESIKDPLSRKWLYVSNRCEAKEDEHSKVLLTKEFGVSSIDISCNATTSLGEIIFDSVGVPYNRFGYYSDDIFRYALESPCTIDIFDEMGAKRTIIVENETGFSRKL